MKVKENFRYLKTEIIYWQQIYSIRNANTHIINVLAILSSTWLYKENNCTKTGDVRKKYTDADYILIYVIAIN